MSFKRNILANYVSQIYVTAVGILTVPLCIKHMGAEAYGLVGFFAMLQAWFNLLDMGLTPTIARESARFAGGAISAPDYRLLARALEGMFAFVALMGGALLFALAEPLAVHWLNLETLATSEAVACLRLVALIVALRWMCGLYRGVISGAERLVWLSGMNSVVATCRFLLVLPVLIFLSASPLVFFVFQLGVALFELAALAWMAYRILPTLPAKQRIRWEWVPMQPVLKFALSIAFTSSVWVLVTQTDKLLLSKILPLGDYGYFTVAVLLASGIMIVSGPVSGALMPRLARLQAEGQHEQLIALYRKATRMVVATALPVTLVLAFFAPQVLWAWTGDPVLTRRAASTLTLYAAGYGFLAMSAFPYYLQYAKGDLKLHLIGSALFLLLLIPLVQWAANEYGMEGAGWAWLAANATYFWGWTPLVHQRVAPGIHWKWLSTDIVRMVLPATTLAAVAAQWMPWSQERWVLFGELILLGAVLTFLVYILSGCDQSKKVRRHCRV